MTEVQAFVAAAIALPIIAGVMTFVTRMGYHYMPAREAAQSGARVAALVAFLSLALIGGKVLWN